MNVTALSPLCHRKHFPEWSASALAVVRIAVFLRERGSTGWAPKCGSDPALTDLQIRKDLYSRAIGSDRICEAN